MNAKIVAYLRSLQPQLDVLGQWAYVPNARTGSTSITGDVLSHRVIMRHRGSKNWDRVWEQIIEPRLDDVLVFTSVRNPWDRVLSGWNVLRQRGTIGMAFPEDAEHSFQFFVGNGGFLNRKYAHFFSPQAPTFMLDDEILDEVYVVRHERREEDWLLVADRLGVEPVLPLRNQSEHAHYTRYYDAETRNIVGRLYDREIEVLGYEFGK